VPNHHQALRGRRRERDALDRLLRDIRAGQSRVLVLRGEAGAGKTALLDYLTGHVAPGRVARAAGVEPETEIAYSALQQLIAPLLAHLGKLPEPQRAALATAFGLSAGAPPEALMIGLAVLGLLAEAAADEPLVCVVDDEDSVARSMARLLRADGFRVHAFPDGSAFLDGMLQWRPDCVLLDVHMPGMSGLDVLRALSQRTEVPPVITCSGDDAPDLPARARALGSLAHLRKPLDEFALLRAIHAAIDASTGPEPPQRPTVSP